VQRLKVYENAKVLATCNGYPAAVRNYYGKGVAEMWGTYITINPEANLDKIIPQFVIANKVSVPITIEKGNDIIVSTAKFKETILVVFTSLANEHQEIIANIAENSITVLNDKRVTLSESKLKFSIAAKENKIVFLKIATEKSQYKIGSHYGEEYI
jgi:hypothetical protein